MSHKNLVETYLDCVRRGDVGGLVALYAPDAVVFDPLSPEPVRGRDAIGATFATFKQAFPDLEWRLIAPLVEDGRRLVFEVEATGVNSGPLVTPAGEIPPTGNAVAVKMALAETLDAEGLIAEEHAYFDATGLAAKLGMAA